MDDFPLSFYKKGEGTPFACDYDGYL